MRSRSNEIDGLFGCLLLLLLNKVTSLDTNLLEIA